MRPCNAPQVLTRSLRVSPRCPQMLPSCPPRPSRVLPRCPPDAPQMLPGCSEISPSRRLGSDRKQLWTLRSRSGVGPKTIMDSPRQVWGRTQNNYGLSKTGRGSDPKQLWTLQNRSGVGPKTFCSFWIWRVPLGTPPRTQNKMKKNKIKWQLTFYFVFVKGF